MVVARWCTRDACGPGVRFSVSVIVFVLNMKCVALIVFLLIVSGVSLGQPAEFNIIPKPRSVRPGEGVFQLDQNTVFFAHTDEQRALAGLANDFFRRSYGFTLKIATNTHMPKKGNVINLVTMPTDGPSPLSSYTLIIGPSMVQVAANSTMGKFYALQTLFQLFPVDAPSKITIPAVTIDDEARFEYRGMHLDVSRHFFPVEFVKKYIDLISQYKFNYFHWHLTDDQGWRIEIKKYPKLTEIGSKRPESVKGRILNPYVGDGVPVEGFYTQEQIKDVVAYAKARFVTVVPEIELPGHSSAALTAYPEFGCKQDYQYKVQTTWGIFKEVYCPTERTFAFLEDVLTETAALFPDSPYIHIGGDEVLKDFWKESPEVLALRAKENLKDEHEVQSYFVRRMEQVVNKLGKRIIGWDEILEGGLAPNATVMSWRGMKGGIEAAKAKHDVIMTPTDFAYLDYAQGDPNSEPLNIGGFVPIDKVYSFEPVPKELTPDETKYIIGGQGNIWTEYMADAAKVEYMAFPRVLAMSEVLWSRPEDRNFLDFSWRLTKQLPRLDKQNVNYRIPEPIGLKNAILGAEEKARVDLTSRVEKAKIYYTIDGSTPDESSTLYEKPFELDVKPNQRVDLKTVVALPTGRKSVVYTATYLRRPYIEPVVPTITEKRAGVTYALATPPSSDSVLPLILSGETRSIALSQFARTIDLKQNFGVTFDGYMTVAEAGMYEFQAEMTWDAAVLLNGEKIIDDTGGREVKTRSAVLPLRAGFHKLSFRYNHRGGDPVFRVRYALKGQQWRNVGGGELIH